jgi:hypothetical protein
VTTTPVPDTSLDYNEEQEKWREERSKSYAAEVVQYEADLKAYRAPGSTTELPKPPEFGRPPERGEKRPKETPKLVTQVETKEENGSRTKYLMQRHSAARALLLKPQKLKRLTRSGIGKLTRELYIANKNANKPINESWDTLALTYATFPADMQTAHEILLALDIEANANPTPKE